ncbi:MAG: PhnD/SsuA/transferrin family substrate-binding protein [Gammaproteobacteria bacterium]|nr:PhnD/SsuA/transferrin family substrate-binding protein [Gammaproteobacteria bacterium]
MRLVLLSLSLLFTAAHAFAAEPVTIGVLSHRGDETTLNHWSKTADYLTAQLPDYHFVIAPLDFSEVDPAVGSGAVDFILVNPAIYVNLELRHRVSRIATMKNSWRGVAYNLFGGVIFARAERYDLNRLEDLRGSTLMAVDETSLGGFMMALRELKAAGLNPYHDLADIRFGGTHDNVVMAVRDGRVDVGTVRTDILERMEDEGRIRLSEFRIINQHLHDGVGEHPDIPLVHSTALYPEWPFSKVQHTSNMLASRVSIALAEMPEDHPAALSGNYAGWTIPLDYQPVHDLLRELLLPPYHQSRRFTLGDVAVRYWGWLLGGLLLLLVMAGMISWVWRLNRALAAAKQQLERQQALILDSVADGIYGVGLDGRTTFANYAMEVLTGWSESELIGNDQHLFLHHTRADGSHFPSSECPVFHTFRDNQARYVDDDIFWCKDGSSIPVEYSSTPIRNAQGAAVGAVVVFRNTAERKRTAEKARQHQSDMAHVARLSTMGEMASGIAHELNQPLSAISNYTRGSIRMLQESGLEKREQLIAAMEQVASQAERAGEIIRQLRRFVRKEEPECEWVEPDVLVRSLLNFIQPELRKSGVRVSLDIASALPSLWMHRIQLEQVLLNLTRNAMEAMQDNGGERLLGLRAWQAGEAICLEVSDNGHGIDAELQERLFIPFITTKKQGMGLGLSISKGIIESYGGQLKVRSKPGDGTHFTIMLPLCGEGHGR